MSGPELEARAPGAVVGTCLRLALLLAACAQLRVDAQCVNSTYSYGNALSAPCTPGATFVSASSGCKPSDTLTAGPSDTSFYLSSTQAEGVSAFLTVAAPARVSFGTGPFGVAYSALVLSRGS